MSRSGAIGLVRHIAPQLFFSESPPRAVCACSRCDRERATATLPRAPPPQSELTGLPTPPRAATAPSAAGAAGYNTSA